MIYIYYICMWETEQGVCHCTALPNFTFSNSVVLELSPGDGISIIAVGKWYNQSQIPSRY